MVKIVDLGTQVLDRYVVFFDNEAVIAFTEEGLGDPSNVYYEQTIQMGGREIALDDCPKRVIDTVSKLREVEWTDNSGSF